jgi:hypothetical protein
VPVVATPPAQPDDRPARFLAGEHRLGREGPGSARGEGSFRRQLRLPCVPTRVLRNPPTRVHLRVPHSPTSVSTAAKRAVPVATSASQSRLERSSGSPCLQRQGRPSWQFAEPFPRGRCHDVGPVRQGQRSEGRPVVATPPSSPAWFRVEITSLLSRGSTRGLGRPAATTRLPRPTRGLPPAVRRRWSAPGKAAGACSREVVDSHPGSSMSVSVTRVVPSVATPEVQPQGVSRSRFAPADPDEPLRRVSVRERKGMRGRRQ